MSARILVVDNYDSFTFNLVQLIEALGADAEVVRNDVEPAASARAREPDGVVLSPGPATPERAGVTLDAARCFAARGTPVLGVCLGHQAIGVAFGGSVARARVAGHGKVVAIRTRWRRPASRGLPEPFEAALYHSLVIDEAQLPAALWSRRAVPEGEVMGVRHRELPIEGVQFHPESMLTPGGRALSRTSSRAAADRRA